VNGEWQRVKGQKKRGRIIDCAMNHGQPQTTDPWTMTMTMVFFVFPLHYPVLSCPLSVCGHTSADMEDMIGCTQGILVNIRKGEQQHLPLRRNSMSSMDNRQRDHGQCLCLQTTWNLKISCTVGVGVVAVVVVIVVAAAVVVVVQH
jgi:hypothetical protein